MLKEAWTLAIKALTRIQEQKVSERLALSRTIRRLGIGNPNVIRLAHRLVVETVRRRNFIDKFINNALEPDSMNEINLDLQAFLRLYVYQTRANKNWSKIDKEEAQKIADLARSILGWKNLRKVEHVLGSLLTQKADSILVNLSDEERIGLLTFHPSWFVRYCFKLFGRKEGISMLEANMQKPPTYIRLNANKMDEDQILERLTVNGIEVDRVKKLRHLFTVVSTTQPLTTTESFQEGLFYIQDKASCFAVEAADPKPGMTVLDVCAAPGAKTTYLAQLMQNKGIIYSIDYSKRRMTAWKRQVARLGVEITEPIIADAYHPLPFRTRADLVVLDPPCTSTGAFGKLPSAKWRLTPRSADKMAEIQWEMINKSAKNVKPRGTLIYSTCSITVEENERVIHRFLKWQPEFRLAEITPRIGRPGLRRLKECQRLYPHLHRCNGFFVAKLIRKR